MSEIHIDSINRYAKRSKTSMPVAEVEAWLKENRKKKAKSSSG